ncbi:MAG TPA: thioredoxin-dependent thiol peroxidase [Longimicrobiales bacterium]|nr:thioredoxin-dependent thiol peroxidase [Longimicrobiales bacterium]
MPAENDVAPDFTLEDENGVPVSLSDFRGRKVVLYFYPKDDTPGCTTQACDLRDNAASFDAEGAVILGVSPDPVKKHRKFKDKYELPFTLLADVDHDVAEKYGVWKEKSFMGRKYWGNVRTTFVIDGDGRIAKVLPNVKPAAHVDQVLDVLRA